MNVSCYFYCVPVSTFLGHSKHAQVVFRIFAACVLSTFSHDAVQNLASLESIAGGARNCAIFMQEDCLSSI